MGLWYAVPYQSHRMKFIPIEAYRASDAKRHRGLQRFCRHPRFARPYIHLQLNRDKLTSCYARGLCLQFLPPCSTIAVDLSNACVVNPRRPVCKTRGR